MAMSVKRALDRAEEIMSHHPTYSMGDDGGVRGSTMDAPSYDCSSFIGTVWSVGEGGWPPATPNMRSEYVATQNFTAFDFGTKKLRQGDILVWNKPGTTGAGADGHTAMVYNKAATTLIECTGSANGVVTGNSVNYLAWQDVIRTKGASGTLGIVGWEPDN